MRSGEPGPHWPHAHIVTIKNQVSCGSLNLSDKTLNPYWDKFPNLFVSPVRHSSFHPSKSPFLTFGRLISSWLYAIHDRKVINLPTPSWWMPRVHVALFSFPYITQTDYVLMIDCIQFFPCFDNFRIAVHLWRGLKLPHLNPSHPV